MDKVPLANDEKTSDFVTKSVNFGGYDRELYLFFPAANVTSQDNKRRLAASWLYLKVGTTVDASSSASLLSYGHNWEKYPSGKLT